MSETCGGKVILVLELNGPLGSLSDARTSLRVLDCWAVECEAAECCPVARRSQNTVPRFHDCSTKEPAAMLQMKDYEN